MTRQLDPANLRLGEFLRPGDRLLWGQATGEPQTLTEALVAQRAEVGPVSVFLGSGFSSTLQPAHADYLRLSGIGGIGTYRRLTQAGVLQVVPCHVGQVADHLERGLIGCDVLMLQVSPADASGNHSYGLVNDYLQTALRQARLVIAEVNDQVPFTHCDALLPAERIDVRIHTSRPPVEVAPAPVTEVERAIAAHVARFVEDGAVLQVGVGAIPDAVLQLLGDRRDLGIHSGMIGDGLVDLVERGVVTNARKHADPGVSITGMLVGTRRLYTFAHRNPALRLCVSATTHGAVSLSGVERLVTVNAAVEVDLTGQVNAEQVGEEYPGGVGGQADYVRAGSRSRGGHSIIALPARARGGQSRLCARLGGPVTSPRSDADIVVTEFGAAELRGQTLAERARRLIAIAAPEARESLEREAHAIARRGF